MLTIQLSDILNSKIAISPRAAQKAYLVLQTNIENQVGFSLSFEGIQDCTSSFCNTLFGKLYMSYDPALLDRLMQITDLKEGSIIQKKVHNARVLGMNENVRSAVNKGLEDLLLS